MGRPAKFNRHDAVEAAKYVFWKQGYAATSVSDLASAMGITRSSFYNSFGDRHSLFNETVALYEKNMIDAPIVNLRPGHHVGGALHLFFHNLCQQLASAPDNCGCLIINSYVDPKAIENAPEIVRQFINDKRSQFKKAAEQANKQGEIKAPASYDIVADAMLAFLVGLNVMARTITDELRLKGAANMFLSSLGFAMGPIGSQKQHHASDVRH